MGVRAQTNFVTHPPKKKKKINVPFTVNGADPDKEFLEPRL